MYNTSTDKTINVGGDTLDHTKLKEFSSMIVTLSGGTVKCFMIRNYLQSNTSDLISDFSGVASQSGIQFQFSGAEEASKRKDIGSTVLVS